MNVGTWFRQSQLHLVQADISTARLDCLVLLEDCLITDRANILAHPEVELSPEQASILSEQIARRARHIPLAYIRGKTEFYGREFAINEHVLEPRPESEILIDLLKFLPHASTMTIADIGTGSGALAITANLDLPGSSVIATDIDPNCLALAQRNARRLQADIDTLAGDLLQPIIDRRLAVDALLCNLPYVPDDFQINTAATHEPRLAIFGGEDGLNFFRTLFAQTASMIRLPKYILTESLPPQHGLLAEVAGKHGYDLKRSEDFIQVFTPASH